MRKNALFVAILSLVVISSAVILAAPKPPSLKSADDPLPDPLVMKDGTRVTTPAQWDARRKEMLEDIMAIQFGHMPTDVPEIKVVRVRDALKQPSEHTLHRFATFTTGPNQEITIRVLLAIPKHREGPFPVIVKIGGGHPDEAGVNQRGYAIAMVDTGQLDPGGEGQDVVGPVQKAYPDLDWGSLATWAWGASRTLDLLTMKERWLFWMQKDIRRFVGREQDLPFDQHFMRALVAPRVVLSNDGYDDTWANNFGTQVCYQGAQSVFDFLGVPKNNMAKFRAGGHTFGDEDAGVMLDVADWYFNGDEFPKNMNNLPAQEYKLKLFPFVEK